MSGNRLANLVAGLSLSDELWRPPLRMVQPHGWTGHIPFAGWLVKVHRPAVLVELGTHSGNSYSAFCQAIVSENTGTRAFAVDTWAGDRHSGSYGEEVFTEWNAFHERHWSKVSSLLRMTFDDALPLFADGSVDLLHIDGLHTYEAVEHDFASWLPKLSQRAIVLFHDTQSRIQDFGVWRFWEEIRDRHPSFEFVHSHGLGVLAVGGDLTEPVRFLIEQGKDEARREMLRDLFRTRHQGYLDGLESWDATGRKAVEEIEKLQAAHSHAQEEAGRLRDDNEELRKARDEVGRQIEALQVANGNAQEEASRLRDETGELRKARDEAEREIGVLRNENRLLREECDRFAAYHDDLHNENGELRGWWKRVERGLHDRLEEARRETGELREANEALRGNNALLQEERDRFLEHRDALLASTAWRMTAPLRGIIHNARLARRLFVRAAPAAVPDGPPPEIVAERDRRLREEAMLRSVGRFAVAGDLAVSRVVRWRSRATARTALVAHVFYPDLAPEILDCYRNLPAGAALFITTPEDRIDATRAAFASVPEGELFALPNRGRDISPFVTLLQTGAFDGYDAVLKLHTKKSPHIRSGDVRRRLLFQSLAGRGSRVTRVLRQFENDAVGMCGWSRSWRTGAFYWMSNRDHIESLADTLGIETPASPAFFEGSMFWFRPQALARLRRARLAASAFEAEAGQTDGCLHHAVERLFAAICSADGYETRDERGRQLLAPEQPRDHHVPASIDLASEPVASKLSS
ncbi:MAG: class I SAM-dependent methyltransferase [Bauldia sp.]|nr:class I SAM-dependent methyltransferase [Bauldia sp.]